MSLWIRRTTQQDFCYECGHSLEKPPKHAHWEFAPEVHNAIDKLHAALFKNDADLIHLKIKAEEKLPHEWQSEVVAYQTSYGLILLEFETP